VGFSGECEFQFFLHKIFKKYFSKPGEPYDHFRNFIYESFQKIKKIKTKLKNKG